MKVTRLIRHVIQTVRILCFFKNVYFGLLLLGPPLDFRRTENGGGNGNEDRMRCERKRGRDAYKLTEIHFLRGRSEISYT